jgi:hypothetical protein
MELKVKLLPVPMPDVIHYDDGVTHQRQEGFTPLKNTIPVKSLTKEQAVEYGELLKNEFVAHHAKMTS